MHQEKDGQQGVTITINVPIDAGTNIEVSRPMFHALPEGGNALIKAAILLQQLAISVPEQVLNTQVYVSSAWIDSLEQRNDGVENGNNRDEAAFLQGNCKLLKHSGWRLSLRNLIF
mmetsp:Transcript_35912/g.64577  ORF Transcript_35912/g.64577 Transcript_35912/m.64577 type:complete len:116 (+) Transcript_35912:170-517(+)